MGTPISHQLAADRVLVREARTLTAVKDVAKRYNFTLEGPHSFLTAQNKVLEHLAKLDKTPSSCHDQGSTAADPVKGLQDSHGGPSPMQGRRLSYSQALGQCQKGSGLTPIGKVKKPVPAPQMRSLSSLHKPSQAPPDAAGSGEGPVPLHVDPAAAVASPVQWHPPSPAFEEQLPAGQQPAARPAAKKAATKKAKQPANTGAQQAAQGCNRNAMEERVASLEQLVQEQAGQLAALMAEVGTLRQQLKASHAAGLSATQGVTTLQSAVNRLQGQSVLSQKLEEAVGRLSSQQQRLAEQQEREECQRSVVIKLPEPLPASQPAAAAQELLYERLGTDVSVLRVRQLGQRRGQGASQGGGRTSYKVLLASSGERDTVLRAKAQRLRGTQYSVDVLLTKQQQARRKALLPAAKRAAEAGQRVQWRYDQLFIDGREYASDSSATEQQQQAEPAGEEGWQQVGRRGRKAAQPTDVGTSPVEEGEIPSSPPVQARQRQQGREQPEIRQAAPPRRDKGANQADTQNATRADPSGQQGSGRPRAQPQPGKQQHGNGGKASARQQPNHQKRVGSGGAGARPKPTNPSRA